MLWRESHRMMHWMVPLPEFSCDPNNRRYTLMRCLMISGATRYFQVRVTVEPDLLELADEMRDFLPCVQVATDVERPKFQNALFAKLRFGCWREWRIFENLSEITGELLSLEIKSKIISQQQFWIKREDNWIHKFQIPFSRIMIIVRMTKFRKRNSKELLFWSFSFDHSSSRLTFLYVLLNIKVFWQFFEFIIYAKEW